MQLFLKSSARALTQIDLELQRDELQIEANKAQVQMQAEFKLRAEQRRQEILTWNSSRKGSRISYKSRLSSRKFYSGAGLDVAAIFGRSKVENKLQPLILGRLMWVSGPLWSVAHA